VACGAPEAAEDAGAARERGASRIGGQVVATVDGHPITLGEVEAVASETGLSPRDALRRLEDEQLLAAHAEASGDGDGAREVEDAARRAAVQAFLEVHVERAIAPGAVPADAVAARYERDRARFERPERRRSTHVLARLEPDAPPEAHAAADRWIRRAIERLQAADDVVAAAHALEEEDVEGRSFRIRAEDIPATPRDAPFVREYLDALFAAPGTGVIPSPVPSRFGLHAIVVTEIVPAFTPPRDEVEGAIREELATELRAARLDALASELASRAPIQLDEASVRRLLARDPEGAP
jgi:hypothetical protein